MPSPSSSKITTAGRKLRAWRLRQEPELSATEAAERLGLGHMSVYRLERGDGTAGAKVIRALTDAGICEPADFFASAHDLTNPSQQCA